MLQKAAPITNPEAHIPYAERVRIFQEQQQNPGTNTKLLMFAGLAVVGYLLLMPKKKTKTSGGLSGTKRTKRTKRKAGKRKTKK
ncbi:MAG: hypothetical protein Q8O62_09930 [Aequorivita sp.]|nr:hypothetical protein [Aequorivita sp.]